ncbi:hypothetical protein NLU13_2694 [Sarocladium strictum]|uniref:PHD-type domain-containing protein n=1 Tax=Sarocladium strictum TaxID=5046 RepID=A0AA39L9S1_SARSR|nr:hypothetical protein NLU13_2694 [Sarocladium strictum]
MSSSTTAIHDEAQADGVYSTSKTSMEQTIERSIDAMETDTDSRVDPDAQTTVTDFLDFTEYLPSDIVRSLTLIGKLDESYVEYSTKVHDLTTTWGQLPTLPVNSRPEPAKLRADISENLDQALSARVFAHAEAVRMSESVHRHYNKAKALLGKLQTMMDNYPAEELRSPAASKSPQLVRSKLAGRSEGGQKIRHKRIPKITVPGEVLAPYDIEYDTMSDDSDISSDEESDIPATVRRTPGTVPRIKLVTSKPPKPRASRPVTFTDAALSAAAAANAAALLNPPPENAVIGSADAPWLQLTQYELAKLRKRMKKNATWTPSETMIARELKTLCRGPDAYREAKKKAEEEGRVFEPKIPAPVVDNESGTQHLPAGAISVDSLANDDVPTSNRGMKLNEAKKLKREAMAKLAAVEAEESERKMAEAARRFLAPPGASPSETGKDEKPSINSRTNNKRKRSGETDAAGESADATDTPSRPQLKRNKTETPVPPPQRPNVNVVHGDQSVPSSQLTRSATSLTPTETPVPIPRPPIRSTATSPTPAPSVTSTVTTTVPTKAPAQTPVPLPPTVASSMARAAQADAQSNGGSKRQTRGEAAKQNLAPTEPTASTEVPAVRSSSRAATPVTASTNERRPASRGDKAASQEPQPNSAADRPRRASTARNTPAPEARPPAKRSKRPAPGIVSTTSSGGNSAVGKRKAAPRKKARTTKRDKDHPAETEMEEVDDEGNPIDPDEPRYCTCNRVSFGTMIQCDNVDNCKLEWFHLECVGLASIPARTTKWYCPDCRKALGLGEKGEVSARGVKK